MKNENNQVICDWCKKLITLDQSRIYVYNYATDKILAHYHDPCYKLMVEGAEAYYSGFVYMGKSKLGFNEQDAEPLKDCNMSDADFLKRHHPEMKEKTKEN